MNSAKLKTTVLARRAFTLVELLVVIAILALLIALMLSAVQNTRAMARRLQCSNNLRQTALAVLQFAGQTERLPAIEQRWSRSQNARLSWRYSILPFLEQQSLFDELSDKRWKLEAWQEEEGEARPSPTRVADVAVFHCPSEPDAPHVNDSFLMSRRGQLLFDAFGTEANFAPHTRPGSVETEIEYEVAAVLNGREVLVATNTSTFSLEDGAPAAWYGRARWNFRFRDVLKKSARLAYSTDGLSRTMLLHEEVYGGRSRRARTRRLSDMRAPGWLLDDRFPAQVTGFRVPHSHHRRGSHVAMADGAVRYIRREISRSIHLALIGRQDGESTTETFD